MQAPYIWNGHGEILARIKRLHVEHQPALAVEARQITYPAPERPVHYLHNLVGLVSLRVEGIVCVRPFKDDYLFGIVLVEVFEHAHLLFRYGKAARLAAVSLALVVQDCSLGIVSVNYVCNGLPRAEYEHVTGKQRSLHVLAATAHAHGGVRRAIHLEYVACLTLQTYEQVGEFAFLVGQRAHHVPFEVNPVQLVTARAGAASVGNGTRRCGSCVVNHYCNELSEGHSPYSSRGNRARVMVYLVSGITAVFGRNLSNKYPPLLCGTTNKALQALLNAYPYHKSY